MTYPYLQLSVDTDGTIHIGIGLVLIVVLAIVFRGIWRALREFYS